MNTATVLVLLAVVAALALAVRAVIKGRGCGGCDGDCSHCGKRPRK